MARVKRGVTTRAKHKNILEQAKGYSGRRKNTIRIARQAVEKAGQYAYRDRKVKKRTFRGLWIQRINAGVRAEGLTYSQFMRPAYAPPALQAVKRDFAFTVPAGLTADALTRAVRGSDKAAITAARVFDLFERPGENGAVKSMAIEVTLQPSDKSFTDADLKAVADKVVAAAERLGAALRG